MLRAGITPADIAAELGVNAMVVRGVLSGRLRGDRGDAHKVAVALQIKDGIVAPDDAPIGEVLRLAGGAR